MDWLSPKEPYSIAHRGASAYATANTISAFKIAKELGADFCEIDLHLTLDDQVVAYHDSFLKNGKNIAEINYSQIKDLVGEEEAPLFSTVLELSLDLDIGIYADIKAASAAIPILTSLKQYKIQKAILGSFNPNIISNIQSIDRSFPCAILVPVGADPFSYSKEIEIIHLCWEKLSQPENILDKNFFNQCKRNNKKVVLWHEENPVRMSKLRKKPVLGICSDRPELVKPFFHSKKKWPVQIICHRGVNIIAPENTISAIHLTFAAGFSHVEIDIHTTNDGELIICHDSTLERTTNGKGFVKDYSLQEIKKLDAGSWFNSYFKKETIPTLKEVLEITLLYKSNLYIEIKNANPQSIWKLVSDKGLEKNCFFWSYDKKIISDLKKISSKAIIMLRRKDFKSIQEILDFIKPDIIEYTIYDDWSDFSFLRKNNISIMVVYGGKEKEIMSKIINSRPNFVNLDYPLTFANLYNQHNFDV